FHVHFGHFGMDLALMKKMGVLASKIITTFHGYDANMKSEKEKQVLIKQYKNLFVQSDTITVNTNYLKDILLQLNCENDKLKIIPMGINMDLFKCDKIKKISTNKPVNLISIGRIIELKGHKYAIQSVKKLIDKGYTIHYTIIGTGRLKNELKNLINKLDVSEHVVLVGKKSQSEIKEYFEASHLFLMSSVTDSDNRREAQGLVTIEAQASGLPVIGFDSGGVKYTFINNKTGILVNEKDTDAYANAIAQLINDVDLYQSCSLAAPEFVNANFNLDITSKKFISLYNN
ncbi:MAG: glycosyltransferase, partial [Bacteroidia bacterium]|nr:glycosyltransferase [Bacteroidia bacterium]